MDGEAELRGEIVALQHAVELALSMVAQITARLDGKPLDEVGRAMIDAIGRHLAPTLAMVEADNNPAAAAGFEHRTERLMASLRTNLGVAGHDETSLRLPGAER